MHYVYILKSVKDGKLYVGMTTDVQKRLSQHNAMKVQSTKGRVPFNVLYTETFSTRQEARDREKYLKSYQGSKEKMTILENL